MVKVRDWKKPRLFDLVLGYSVLSFPISPFTVDPEPKIGVKLIVGEVNWCKNYWRRSKCFGNLKLLL